MDHKNKNGQHKIAIVGVGALFPGAVAAKEFWLNILAEKDFVKDVPETHWLKEDYYDPAEKSGDKIYCKKGAFLDDISFDPVEFGMPPNLLSTTDTVQLLSLVVARDTLADTLSYQEGKVDKKKISVILGVAGGTELIGQMSARIHTPEWVMAMRKQGLPESKINAIKEDVDKCYTQWTENTFPGLLGNVVSGRVANRFDLKGTNCVLDAACASSLAAVKMAVQELQLGTTDMVITGGSDALNDIFMYMCFSKTTALSPTEDCRPFSDTGDGTVLGEGVAMMSLKRLEDAERDGDRIYAIISSIGSSSDGKSGSIYAPDSNGQSLAIKRAYEEAGFIPDEIGLVEAHGTGTMAGDYAEFNGLKLGFGETARNQFCALGSVKSMIGHTKSAAGAASLLKVAMSLNNAILPPTIKVARPNTRLKIEDSPFYLNTAARPWIHDEAKSRKAGVSSMGFGGTNFHVALEEYVNKKFRPRRVYRPNRELLLFSGKSRGDILAELENLVDGGLEQDLVQIAKSTQTKFDASDTHRLAILGENLQEIFRWVAQVQSELGKDVSKIEINNNVYYSDEKLAGSIAFIFSGQGSQYVNMGAELLMQFDEALAPWNKISSMQLDADRRLNNVVYPIPAFTEHEREAQSDLLVDTQWAQPAIGTLAVSHLNLLSKLNVVPSVVGGHSFGEIVALYASGAITNLEDLVRISRKRGELMAAQTLTGKGAMTAVMASAKIVSEILNKTKTKVVIANINSPKQTVITGYVADIENVEQEIEKEGLRYQRLKVSTAFHSELVAGSSAEFEKYLKTIRFGKLKMPVYSNATASHYPDKNDGYAKILANQLAAPVRFEEQINAMYEEGARIFLEVGPGKVLGNFVKDILQHRPHRSISIDGGKKQNSKDAFWNALAQLSVSGIPLSFGEIWRGADDNKRVSVEKKHSIATVKINGSNYGKPYPPPGGFKSLPKPNPEIAERIEEPFLPWQDSADIVVEPSLQEKLKSDFIAGNEPSAIALDTDEVNNQNEVNIMNGMNNQWLEAFQEIQKNTHEAQKGFQETLAQSHKLFLETSQIAYQHLSKALEKGIVHPDIATPPHLPSPTPDTSSQQQPQPPVQNMVKPVSVVTSTVVSVSSSASADKLTESLLHVVSDKTGYPSDMLEMDMDMEADLGIDSIKRVEIFGAMQEAFPDITGANPKEMAVLRTLGQIVNYLGSKTGDSASETAAKDTASPSQAQVAASANLDKLTQSLLHVVSDKTGYPSDMLEMDMDMEADLGIDSIKRVEIFGAMQEAFPDITGANPKEMAVLRTLGQIVNYLGSKTGGLATEAGTENVASPLQILDTALANLDKLTESLLQVVSDKTGYPSDMLEMDMDMEADLGIDSIKRVEIFGAMQEAFPDMTGANPKEMAVLRTLGQIVNYIGSKTASLVEATKTGAEAIASLSQETTPANLDKLTPTLLQVVSDKTGYPSDMLEMDMDMEADLGIDSIKRVEIFGAMQEAFPDITGANPKEMAVLRTLGQIVNYLSSKTGNSLEIGNADSLQPEQKKKSGNFPLIQVHETIKRYEARLKYLPKPDKLHISWSDQNTIVITDNGSETVSVLCAKFLELSLNVVLLHFPGSFAKKSKESSSPKLKHVYLDQISDKAIEKALHQVESYGGEITALLHIHNDRPLPSFETTLDEEPWIKAAFFLAKHFKTKLNEYTGTVRKSFICVSMMDGALGFKNPSNYGLLRGAYSGLVKTLNIEWPTVFCRAIDIAPSTSHLEAADIIFAELHDPNLDVRETGYLEGKRNTIIADLANPKPESLQDIELTANDVLLVTGGARGITSSCISRLAELYRPKFILIGRSSLGETEPSWAVGLRDEKELKKKIAEQISAEGIKPLPAEVQKKYQQIISRREIEETLGALQAAGSQALYYQGDVRDTARLKEIVKEATDKLGKITGVLHGAGALADKLIENKTEQDFDLVFSIKVKGLFSVLNAVDVNELKHLLMFSSVAGFFGNPGQSDYALSNEILNKTALLVSNVNPHCKVVAYNWGPWEGGMVSPELKRQFAERNVFTIPLAYGADIFVGELSSAYSGNVQVVIGSPLPMPEVIVDSALRNYKISRKLRLDENAFLLDHVIAGNAVLPVVNAVTWIADAGRQLYPSMKITSILDTKLYKGIVFDKKFKEDFTVEIQELHKNNEEIIFEGTLYSSVQNQKNLIHYKTQVKLSRTSGEPPVYVLDPNSLSPTSIQAEKLYHDGTLFHGPFFRGITEIVGMGENDFVMKCRVDKVPEESQGQFQVSEINPFVIDVQFQGMLVWAKHLFNSASLPVKQEKGMYYRPLHFGIEYFVAFHLRHVSPVKMIADIYTYDKDGYVYVESTGAEIVMSKELNDAFSNRELLVKAE